MDSISQAVLGAAIGEAGFRRKLGFKGVVAGAIFGTLPDLDVVAAIGGQWSTVIHHRGISHALIFAPVMAPLLGWPGKKAFRSDADLLTWMHLAFWAVITHPLLDICTPYGTQLFLPFANTRVAIDAVFSVDPFYTLPLLCAVIVAWFTRARPQVGQWLATGMLCMTTAYLVLGYAQSQRAITLFESALSPAQAVTHARAIPITSPTLLFRTVGRTPDDRFMISTVSTWTGRVHSIYEVDSDTGPAVEAMQATDRGAICEWFMMGYDRWHVQQGPDGQRVCVDDMRYGLITTPTQAYWGACADVIDDSHVGEPQWVQADFEGLNYWEHARRTLRYTFVDAP